MILKVILKVEPLSKNPMSAVVAILKIRLYLGYTWTIFYGGAIIANLKFWKNFVVPLFPKFSRIKHRVLTCLHDSSFLGWYKWLGFLLIYRLTDFWLCICSHFFLSESACSKPILILHSCWSFHKSRHAKKSETTFSENF